jgi:hypothetical protein
MKPAFLLGEKMNEKKDVPQKDSMEECATRLTSAAQALEQVIGKLDAQYEALNQKIDRIIATVEKQAGDKSDEKVAASAQPGHEAQQRTARKTLPPLVNTLLAKSGVGESTQIEVGTLDKALGALTIEQRIAVKAELARAGMIA